jgi:hypothetical protein
LELKFSRKKFLEIQKEKSKKFNFNTPFRGKNLKKLKKLNNASKKIKK